MHGGLGIDHRAYSPGLDGLSEAMRLVYYDHRCHGASGRPPLSTLTLARLADDADELREHLREDRIGVLGHSFGGFIAYEFAARHPDRLAFLIIVCSSPALDYADELARVIDERATPAMREVLSMPAPTSSQEWAARNATLLPLYFHRWSPAHAQALVDGVSHDHQAAIAAGADLSGWDRWSLLPEIEVPTLLVVGRHDFIPHLPRAERAVGLMPNATLAVMERSGHYPWLEEPTTFTAMVCNWIREKVR